MIHQTFLILSILLSAAVAGEGENAAYNPTEVFLFNCGDTSDHININGRNWTAEQPQFLPSNSDNASFSSDVLNQGSVPRVPYMKARIFQSVFTYNFPVSPGRKFLRLHFYPTRYANRSSLFDAVNSYFAVTANGFTLLKNFSADLTAKVSNTEFFIKEFVVPVLDEHTMLNLTFTPSPNSLAFVNGIELVSMPDRLFEDTITNVGSNIDYNIENSTAFETVYRLNVGGQMISDVDDSGMFRQWRSDDDVFLGENSGIKRNEGVKINYTEKTPAYVAPENVYTTYRMMGNPENPKINLNFNLTWLFTVDAGFGYLVRLHFCETLQEVTAKGQRIFSIYIENQIAKLETDVIYLSGGSRIPVYLDFYIYVDAADVGTSVTPNLRLDLHPLPEVSPMYYDVILNGVEILKLNDSDGNLAGPNPILPELTENPETPPTSKGNNNNKKSHVLVIILSVIGSAIVLAIFVVAMLFMKKKKKKKNDFSEKTASKATESWAPLTNNTGSTKTSSTTSLPSDLCRRFSIFEIKSATNNFEKKLIVGEGGFGSVYKGRIDGGATLVAVKRLKISSNQGSKEFETELQMLSVLRHIHLVSLIGYCDDENEMVLVYEYMPRGTVSDHLYKRNKAFDPPLSWKQRLEICIGAARGLQYLHTGAKHTIIHRDIKTTNILLDENYVAKVSDFGLSKVGPTSASQTHVTTFVKGSFGYLDPEYYRRQVLTEKSDVYSFGVVLFEVLCCRPVKLLNVPREQENLIRWVKLNYNKGTVDQIVDSDLTGDITSTSLAKFCEVAARCVQDRGIDRPSMNDVVWQLEFALQLHETAKKKNDDVESLDLMKRDNDNLPRGLVGTTTDEEDELFSKTTGHVAISSTTDDDSAPILGNERSGSNWGVFSEINEPKAR